MADRAAGWRTLPDGLTAADLRDLATMAGSRRDRTMQSVCRQHAMADGRASVERLKDASAEHAR